MHSTTVAVDMTIVCIDILEKNFRRESEITRTAPLFAGHSGIRAGLKLIQKLIEHGSGTTLRLHEFS